MGRIPPPGAKYRRNPTRILLTTRSCGCSFALTSWVGVMPGRGDHVSVGQSHESFGEGVWSMRGIQMLRSRAALAVVALAMFVGLGRSASAALIDITAPTDEILIVNGQNDGDANGGNPPAA